MQFVLTGPEGAAKLIPELYLSLRVRQKSKVRSQKSEIIVWGTEKIG